MPIPRSRDPDLKIVDVRALGTRGVSYSFTTVAVLVNVLLMPGFKGGIEPRHKTLETEALHGDNQQASCT